MEGVFGSGKSLYDNMKGGSFIWRGGSERGAL